MNIISVQYNPVRATEEAHAHTNVYFGGDYMGYTMRDDSPHRAEGANWVFVSGSDIPTFVAKNWSEMKDTIEDISLGKEVALKLHFNRSQNFQLQTN